VSNVIGSTNEIIWKSACMIVMVLAFGHGACENPFQTRTPEPPTRTQRTWLLPREPGDVFTNLRNALADLNVVNYKRCFADSFRFIPEATVAHANPGKFDGWNLQKEGGYLEQMLNPLPPDSAFTLRLDSLSIDAIGSESIIYLQRYELIARHRLQNVGVPRKVSGEGRFWLSRSNFGDWSIYRWEDFASGSAFTWSTLKARFYNEE
jgi:hypothetical protein